MVLDFFMETNSVNALHGQVTIGTLIFQDCVVGSLFALLRVLGGTSSVLLLEGQSLGKISKMLSYARHMQQLNGNSNRCITKGPISCRVSPNTRFDQGEID